MIFGTGPSHSPPTRQMEHFEVNDSAQGETQDWSQRNVNEFPSNPRPSALISIISYPFQLLSSIFRFIFSVLRIPIPHIPFLSLNFYRPLRPTRATSRGIDSWIRELEEETGAVCIGSASSAVASGIAGPSSSGLTARGAQPQKHLPNFVVGTYEDTLRRCQKENRVGCVILVSEEHDDDAEFKRTTLTDPTFVNLLVDSNFIVWGGDVRDLEPYTASEKLQATTYPFVAFVSNQPTRSSSSQSPTLTVLSRHQGASNTSPTKLVEHLTSNLLPRVQPYLQRLVDSQRAIERDRMLRQQQDQAFQDAARRDTDRIRAKMAQEKAAEAERQAEARRAEAEELERQRAVEERERLVKERMVWRRWARQALVPAETSSDKLRIAIRLPNGSRLMRRFSPEATLSQLYAFVDKEFIPAEYAASADPAASPKGGDVESVIGEMGGEREWWGFKLLSSYPRAEVAWKANVRLGEVPCLKDGGGQLIVEMDGGSRRTSMENGARDDDGYDTESDED
ncbi:hypothetical protein BDZ89DRAFT_1224605 [Hymenopellis radicata]|nr:hypothetical protein BDZ89DRAFT_1224605 [Hymenopellis radicata]